MNSKCSKRWRLLLLILLLAMGLDDLRNHIIPESMLVWKHVCSQRSPFPLLAQLTYTKDSFFIHKLFIP